LAKTFRGNEGDDRDPKLVTAAIMRLRLHETKHVLVAVNEAYDGGFKLITKRDMGNGSILFKERPFVCYPSLSHACDYCFKWLSGKDSMKHKCSNCSVAYCSEFCQDAALKAGHYQMCIDSDGNKEWQTIKQTCSATFPDCDRKYLHALVLAFKLTIKAGMVGLPSALKLPELKLLQRCNDLSIPLPADCNSVEKLVLPLESGAGRLRSTFIASRKAAQRLIPRDAKIVDFLVLHGLLYSNLLSWSDSKEATTSCHSGLFLLHSFANQATPGTSDKSNAMIVPPNDRNPTALTVLATNVIMKKEEVVI
jgi:hypothetical protein